MIPPILLRFAPQIALGAAVFFAGFGAAWYVQGLRITACKQELVEWQQAMTKAVQAGRDFEYAKNVEAQNAWSKNLDELRRTWRTGWVPVVPTSSGTGIALPPSGGTDGSCKDAVSTARELAAQCGETTLQLNQLQQRIEAQQGY